MKGTIALRCAAAAGAAAFVLTAPAPGDEGGVRPDATMLQFPDVSAEHIVFVYANDLYRVGKDGGTAVRLASPPGKEGFPRFSPDGRRIAFMGNYEGNSDLYVLPAEGGGVAERVTHHPGTEILSNWTPDGRLLFWMPGAVGLPELLPVPYGANGSISSDGEWLAYTPHSRDHRTWKRYRGGMATDIWLFNLKDSTSRRITDWEGTDSQPMWHGRKVYYLSDAGPEHRLNIWVYDVDRDRRRQVTSFSDYDVKYPSIGPDNGGPGEIVFQAGPSLYLLDLQTGRSSTVDIVVPGDRPTLRPKHVEYARYLSDGDVSSTGKRGVVEARGELWSVPAEKGVVRNLTRTDGVAERDPLWSPDGRWIAYVSDATGEYEIYVTQSDGNGETRQLTSDATCWRLLKAWSPDSKLICHSDKTGAVHLLDVESGESTHVVTDSWAVQWPVSFSHDSKWLAFAMSDTGNSQSVVHVYDIENGELHRLTGNMFTSTWPVFDREGKYLYFASNRAFSPTYSDIDQSFVYRNSDTLLAVPLNGEVENPWIPESDEEEWEEDEEETEDEAEGAEADGDGDEEAADGDEGDDEAAEEPKSPIHGVWEGVIHGLDAMGMPELSFKLTVIARDDGTFFGSSEAMGESRDFDEVTFDEGSGAFSATSNQDGVTLVLTGTLEGDTLTGTWEMSEMGISGDWEATRTDEEVDESAAGGEAEPVKIDFDDFEARAMMLPVPPGSFGNLAVNDKNQLIYIRAGDGMPSIKLFDIDDPEKGERNVVGGAMGFAMSADGKKLAVQGATGFAIVSAAPGQSLAKPVDMSMLKGWVDPREEWKQIFHEAWRLQRDFFYDPNMHGVDWDTVRERYAAMVDDCVTREDLSFVIGEMIAELNVGHAYYGGGDGETPPSENVGLLGCDFELATTDEGTAYRIKAIHEGASWDADARGPLSQPGVDVKEGDFLLAVNGVPVSTALDPWAPFVGLAGQVTELTVSDRPVIDEEARRVLIKPMGSESNLRFRAWIESKRRYVEEATDGRIGYIYVRNTGIPGQNDLFRQFYGQIHKDGLIIDERWNGGGQIPTRFIELLNRPRTNYWARRDGKDWPWPPDSHQGPKCMLINGLAGSGGDMFPALFRQAGIGKLIGMRTWGGLVGMSGNPGLIDGARVTVPTFGFYEKDGTWGIEGHGVDPDIEVIDDPALMVDGSDPQLDAAIEHILAEVKRNPYVPAKRPDSPDRSGMGITEQDK
ncbi:MAG: S41 family peptidase [Planctomycetota bacterium]|jgi:tricorn protease